MKSSRLGATRIDRIRVLGLSGVVVGCVAISIGLLHSWNLGETSSTENAASVIVQSNEPIQPIEPLPGLDPRKIELGRKLFHDPQLSHNDQLSCAHCHNLKTGGTDRKARSTGINGAVGVINAPTVLNSGFNFSQFWDGRAATLETQIDGPLQSEIEMGSTWPEVIGKLKRDQEYVQAFKQIYGDEIRNDHVRDAIAEFERSLSTPNSPFDRYLRHEPGALTSREQEGYKLFKSFGCASCHQGVSVGGNMYQKLGVMAPYFADRGNITKADLGRFNVTGDQRDMYMFKVPSLRNVELTAPYFHDGSAATLADAVRLMAKYQLGRHLTDQEVELIVEFLKTLTGELNGKPL
ncbi:MAG TPA: cytochrome-c peroxidase [Terriglobales bacterium]|nr:cytochrome-c peroxidase [Terriglobales bacterium]